MSGYRVHLIAGAVTGAAALTAATQTGLLMADRETQAALFCVTLASSIFPDIDTPSKGRPWFYGALAAADAFLIYTRRYFWASLLGFMAMLPCIGGHRGWTHTWWAMLLVPLPLLLAPVHLFGMSWRGAAVWYLAAVLGYASHLVLDEKW